MASKSHSHARVAVTTLNTLLKTAEKGCAAYTRHIEDKGIARLIEYHSRPRSWWERLFRVKRHDPKQWTRKEQLNAAAWEFHSYSFGGESFLHSVPWEDCVNTEKEIIGRLYPLTKYAADDEAITVSAEDLERLDIVASWAARAKEAGFRNESV